MRLALALAGVSAACGASQDGTHGGGGSRSGRDVLSAGEHHMDVGSLTLHYHVAGSGPVCIVHPGGPGADWSYLRMPEVERSLTLVYLEPLGTGESTHLPSPHAYSYTRYADLLEALRAHLGLQRVCLFGHSHGGMVGLTYAIHHDDHVSGLILYATTAALDEEWQSQRRANMVSWFGDRPWFAEASAAGEALFRARTDREANEALQAWMPLLFADWESARPRLEEQLRAMRVWAGPSRYRGPQFDVTLNLGRIDAPTLVIAGARDFMMPAEVGARIQQGIPGAELVVIENAGHFAHLEQPAAFAQAVVAFVPRLGAPPPSPQGDPEPAATPSPP